MGIVHSALGVLVICFDLDAAIHRTGLPALEETMGMTIGQAIRNAVEAERAAARFYALLAESTNDPDAQLFLTKMQEDEIAHAKSIESLALRVTTMDLPVHAQGACESVETAPAWKYVDGIDYLSALQVALEAERSAALYYSAMADVFEGEQRDFFEELSATEENHAKRVEEMIAKATR